MEYVVMICISINQGSHISSKQIFSKKKHKMKIKRFMLKAAASFDEMNSALSSKLHIIIYIYTGFHIVYKGLHIASTCVIAYIIIIFSEKYAARCVQLKNKKLHSNFFTLAYMHR